MELSRMRKSVVRVVMLQPSESGGMVARTLYKKDRKKNKKQTKGLKDVGKGVRRIHAATRAFEDEYVKRHNRSNRKRRDGWARDMTTNVTKATRKGAKKVQPSRWI